jgi:hypothetical protein
MRRRLTRFVRKKGMTRFAPLVLLALAAGCGNYESPTAPLLRVEANATFDERFTLDNPMPVLRPGETITIGVRAKWAYPLGVGFGCAVPECEVAQIRGEIGRNSDSGTITITALKPGTARIVGTIWNMGRAPGTAIVGEVFVEPVQARRRSVRH